MKKTKKRGVQSRKKAGGDLGGSVDVSLSAIARMITPEMSKRTMLEQYRKSLYVFACVSKIATAVASVPFHLYKIVNSKGDMKKVENHPLLDLLAKPNPFHTRREFWEITLINLKCTGEAFWFKLMDDRGVLQELWNMRPDMMTAIADPVNFIKGYEFTRPDGSKQMFAPEEIVHFHYPDPLNQMSGLSPIRASQKRILTEEYATKWQADFFLNSARPDGLIKNTQSTLTKEQKDDIRESWHKRHGGLNNSYKVAILEGGLDYQLISISQKEMDYIESLKFTRDDILVAFGVPKPLVAVTEDVNRANAETAMEIFLAGVVKDESSRVIEKINECITYDNFSEDLWLESEDPTPENEEGTLKRYESGLQNNYLLINEVRAEQGLPPVRGGWSFYMPLINVAVGGLSSADQQKMLQRIVVSGDEANEKACLEAIEKRKMKTFNFNGRFMLRKRLEIKELVLEEMAKVKAAFLKRKKAGKPMKKKSWKPIIPESMRGFYFKAVNDKIDRQVETSKDKVNGFFAVQGERVMASLKTKEIKKALKTKALTGADVMDVANEKTVTTSFIMPLLEQWLKDAGLEALNMLAPQEDFTDTAAIQSRLKKRAEQFGEDVTETTLQSLNDTLAEGIAAGEGIDDLANRVSDVYSEFPTFRSDRIARTEATASNAEGALEGFRQSGVATGKEWINSGDDRVRDAHQDAPEGVGTEIVALDSPFSNGLQYPQEPNCRCVLGPAFME